MNTKKDKNNREASSSSSCIESRDSKSSRDQKSKTKDRKKRKTTMPKKDIHNHSRDCSVGKDSPKKRKIDHKKSKTQYSEPQEAIKPKRKWSLCPFEGVKPLQTLYIDRKSAYVIGRDCNVADLKVYHPSCSRQHAAIQYRLVTYTREDGTTGKRVRPYLIDLESSNGTYINNKKIDPNKYVELLKKDIIKFGVSTREYVVLYDKSKDDTQDDDVKQEEDVKQEDVVTVKDESDSDN